jgi:hypothetical protein
MQRKSAMAKPPLTLVGPGSTTLQPPRKLGAAGQALWDAVTSEYQICDAGGTEILAQACQATDRVEELAERISADGPVVHTRGGPKAHPALRDELHGRAFIVRCIEKLGLNYEALRPSAGHPPNLRGA